MTIGPSTDLASSPRSARDLPRPVARFRAAAMKDGQAVVETVLIETTAWMRRPGMPRMPLEIRMAHRLGREFVHDIRIGRGRLSFRFGLDAYVDGHGLMKVGPSVQTGVEFDQGALIALWGEALGFPSAWEHRGDVRWEAVDADTARLVVPGPEGDIPIIVAFDPETSFPVRCEAQRYKSKGPKIGWTGHSSEWRRFAGVLAPGRYTVQWADEPCPWIDIRTTSVTVNAPVDDAIARGRAALIGVGPGRAVSSRHEAERES
jgi:hypothetical protein